LSYKERLSALRAEVKKIRHLYADLLEINPADVELADVMADIEKELASDD